MNEKNKFYLMAEIEVHEETAALKKKASSVIPLPTNREKQPDLLYMSALFVSSGTNLNLAHFLTSELLKAEGSIVSKAVDVEHKEDQIIGAIYDRRFVDREGKELSMNELASTEADALDKMDVDVLIACVIYKNRFPELAKEISDGKWCVSMEAYFTDFDLKIGELILSRKEAEALGLTSDNDNIFGRIAKVIKNGKEIAEDKIARVLRGIVFSGVGIVQHPANIASVVLETAHTVENKVDDMEEIILNYDKLDDKKDNNNVTSLNIETSKSEEDVMGHKDDAELQYDDTVGICVSFKKEVIDATVKGPNTKILHTNWCSLYEASCTSFSRDTTDPKCLKNKICEEATLQTKTLLKSSKTKDNRKELVGKLLAAFDKAAKYIQRR